MTTTITGITRSWFEWDFEGSSHRVWVIETELETNPLDEHFNAEQLAEMLEKIQTVIDESDLSVEKIILRSR